MLNVAIIGAGVSGLTAARILKDRYNVTVYERADKPGGLIRCERIDGSLFHTCGGHVFNTKNPPPLQPGDILLHGHTHLPAWEAFGDGFRYWNPGSAAIPKNGTPHSYMTLEDGLACWKELSGDVFHTERVEE